jgi:hypothetical protein
MHPIFMKTNLLVIGILLVLNTGCIFSSDDIREVKVMGNYYLISFSGDNSLIYKEPDATTDKVIYQNVDSIGWNEKFIFGVADRKYFLFGIEQQNLINRYESQPDFIEGCKRFGVVNVTLKSTNDLQ